MPLWRQNYLSRFYFETAPTLLFLDQVLPDMVYPTLMLADQALCNHHDLLDEVIQTQHDWSWIVVSEERDI